MPERLTPRKLRLWRTRYKQVISRVEDLMSGAVKQDVAIKRLTKAWEKARGRVGEIEFASPPKEHPKAPEADTGPEMKIWRRREWKWEEL